MLALLGWIEYILPESMLRWVPRPEKIRFLSGIATSAKEVEIDVIYQSVSARRRTSNQKSLDRVSMDLQPTKPLAPDHGGAGIVSPVPSLHSDHVEAVVNKRSPISDSLSVASVPQFDQVELIDDHKLVVGEGRELCSAQADFSGVIPVLERAVVESGSKEIPADVVAKSADILRSSGAKSAKPATAPSAQEQQHTRKALNRCRLHPAIANNFGVLKVLAPLPVLSGRNKGPEVDSSLMRSECSVEGNIMTVPEFGAGPHSADSSSDPSCSNADDELLNVVVCVSGDCCVDLEEQIDSESIQQFAEPRPVAGVSAESGEIVQPGIAFLLNSGNVHECTFLLGAAGDLDKRLSAEDGANSLLLKQSAIT
ncbi:hypothetical protein Nepgr_006760 [Nepenthes gracilis]|uniref:Uncharacterized protein n=1 Tax=Nepenthes gracilis TaxID=150966 RepID=A0AAD3XHR2_NEPGR|nr:hypothetical protein Nepgr_006760 [Nepenthes gracilis]